METQLRVLDTMPVNDTNVIYRDRTYRVLSIKPLIKCSQDTKHVTRYKPKFLKIYVINEDGEFEILDDETWCFEFKKKKKEKKKKWLLCKRRKTSK